jgi:putative addiction module component (TIGR02574 family)
MSPYLLGETAMGELAELFKLSAAERIQLAEDLWDSVAADPDRIPPLTEAQRREIERRLADHAANSSAALPWEEVRAWLWSRVG